MNKPSFCIANWKMNKTFEESIDYMRIIETMDLSKSNSKVIICPSYLVLNNLIKRGKQISDISFGAQNVSSEIEGSFTGEVSINMLKSISCKWVIIGHSERRLIMKETDSEISKKMKLAYNADLNPILCIGETFEENQNNETNKVLERQILTAFESLNFKKNSQILIAYEPIWAIGTGIAADKNSIKSNIQIIKNIINNIDTKDCNICLLYGGSVDERNATDIFSIENVNGFLIGTSSLDAKKFCDIYRQI